MGIEKGERRMSEYAPLLLPVIILIIVWWIMIYYISRPIEVKEE